MSQSPVRTGTPRTVTANPIATGRNGTYEIVLLCFAVHHADGTLADHIMDVTAARERGRCEVPAPIAAVLEQRSHALRHLLRVVVAAQLLHLFHALRDVAEQRQVWLLHVL